MSASKRNFVNMCGVATGQPMVFAHGYGCDQTMWRLLTPAFQSDYKIVLFDYVGFGNSDPSYFDPLRYATLQGYAQDLLEICRELNLEKVLFVGHSVSAMIGVLAAIEAPSLFDRLILIGPSPCYINDGDYVGGFTKADIDNLLEFLDINPSGWAQTMAPLIMQNPERPELAAELAASFCRAHPEIAKHFAKVTFLSDSRLDLARLNTPSVILQCDPDSIAPVSVGQYTQQHLRNSSLLLLQASGHCPHLSAPAETIAAIHEFLNSQEQYAGQTR